MDNETRNEFRRKRYAESRRKINSTEGLTDEERLRRNAYNQLRRKRYADEIWAENRVQTNKRRQIEDERTCRGLSSDAHLSHSPTENAGTSSAHISAPQLMSQSNVSEIPVSVHEVQCEAVAYEGGRNDLRSRFHIDNRTMVLPAAPACTYCGAYKFHKETIKFCCSGGQIRLAQTVLPDQIVALLIGTDLRCKEFQSQIRTYNNYLAFTSIGIYCDRQFERRDHGIYTVRVQGQIHHFLNDLIPGDGVGKMQGVQFYFYDPQHQVENRLSGMPRLERGTVEDLVNLMEQNPYSIFLKQASSLGDLDKYTIVIRSQPGLDQRVFNKPMSDEVAGIWVEDESGSGNYAAQWDTRVYTRSGRTCKVQYYFGCYDPLQYVLMFPNGEPGWHANIAKVGRRARYGSRISQLNVPDYQSFDEVLDAERRCSTHASLADTVPSIEDDDGVNDTMLSKRATVSCREYYVYKLQMRLNDRSYILRFGRLLQQYVVDIYIKIESMRLAYHQNSQKKLRQEQYQGIVDSLISGTLESDKVGKRTYLPASFIGGRRDLRNRYLDSMALVQTYGRPDIFLTMTCNPNWPEIKSLLSEGEEAQNRPDLCARVFKAKLTLMHQIIMNGQIFGRPSSVVHVVEFQKRGLPHAHFLIILSPDCKYENSDVYDKIVSAELLDEHTDPYLHSLVVKHMMHGPCGHLNSGNVCMRDGKCKNHYPKEFAEMTTHGKGNYPIYRRRDNQVTARVRGKMLDNRWVIPYNPELLLHFNCHVNVEICCDIRAVKYLYKYVHKGHDKINFRITSCTETGTSTEINEITDFQNARWVSPVEAIWRIYAFPLYGMYPAVMQLQVHLPNFQSVQFEDDSDLQAILQNERNKRTMLTEFFRMNATSEEAKRLNLLYKDFPLHYVWDRQARNWTRRKRSLVRGRLCVVNPIENERYYLRVLLNNVHCPTSFEDLLTVDGIICASFRDAAYKRGLLHNDEDMETTLEETSIFGMAPEMRRLFAILIYYCRPANPAKLFDQFYNHLAEDFIREKELSHLSDENILRKVLEGINFSLEPLGGSVNDYQLTSIRYDCTEFERFTREINAERNIPILDEDLHGLHQLNMKQREAFDAIYSRAASSSGGVFFVDGPGGIGKSFLYKVLLAHIRSKGYIALVVASSGIASSIFLGGRTAHSRFKIPIDTNSTTKCQISFQSSEAELIRASKIIIWDEATMADKTVIQAVNELLQDLCKDITPFGGKLIVFGGDFRQVLPVVRYGGRKDQVDASILSSDLWQHFEKFTLTENMRAREDPDFIDFLMRVGNGEEPTNDKGQIHVPHTMLIPYTSLENSLEMLISYVYPDMLLFQTNPYEMMTRTILCPTNEHVDDINSKLIARLEGEEVVYISDDRAKNTFDQGDYVDYLNTLEPRGIPQHRLVLKVNAPIILLRNINPVEGLCNGTRLICKHLLPTVIGAVIATGQHKGKYVWIPRIPLEPSSSDNKYLIPFVRRQIPVKLCFAMTINKAQGQTLNCVGIYLRVPVFTHGQLYVGLSRAKTGTNVKVLVVPSTQNEPPTPYTPNIVYKEVLAKAGLN